MEFTAVFRKVPEGYIAFVEELPGANTQASTLGEARKNLREAVALVLEANCKEYELKTSPHFAAQKRKFAARRRAEAKGEKWPA